MWLKLKRWAKRLKADIRALALAVRDPRVPLAAKVMAAITVAYALSPIDLIPDFIPVLGFLDDLLLLPLGIWLTIQLLPAGLLEQYRQRVAETGNQSLAQSKTAAFVIILIWLLSVLWLGQWAWQWFQNSGYRF